MNTDRLWSRRFALQSVSVLSFCILYHVVVTGVQLSTPFWSERTFRCEQPAYKVRMLSHDPLMMHVEDFITPFERQYLLDVA